MGLTVTPRDVYDKARHYHEKGFALLPVPWGIPGAFLTTSAEAPRTRAR
jgi:hypothetical protein